MARTIPSDSVMDGVRKPSQKRGQQALDRVLATGAELMAQHGYQGLKLAEVSKRSGVSYGAMHWHVESKDALVHAIHRRFVEQSTEGSWSDVAHTPGSRPVAEVVDGAVREIARIFSFDPPLFRALMIRATADPVLLEATFVHLQQTRDAFTAEVEPELSATEHVDPQAAVDAIYTAVMDAMTARITWPELHQGATLPWDQFVDGVSELAVAHIKSKFSAGPTSTLRRR